MREYILEHQKSQ